MDGREKIIYPELSYALTGLCFKTQNIVGRFGRERQYCDVFERQLQENDLYYEREKEIPMIRDFSNKADFVIENKVLMEMKAEPFITKNDYMQTKRYLQASGLKLGLIVNFRSRFLKPKRVINSEAR